MLCLYSYCFSEMAPVCAVVGGVLGQEIVKVGSHFWFHSVFIYLVKSCVSTV